MPNDARVLLVTGSRKGIGEFLTRHYVARGWTVIGCSRSAPDWSLDGYEHFLTDVGDERQVIELLQAIRKRHGRVDAVINNAGIASMNHVMLTPGSSVERVFRTNFFGSFFVAREAAKIMSATKAGRIVNFSTVARPLNLEGEAAYASSKAAVETFTRILARELAPWNITVNAIGPTPIDTDLTRGVPPAKLRELESRLVIKRTGRMEEVAYVIDFFLAPGSDAITGQIIYLGGV